MHRVYIQISSIVQDFVQYFWRNGSNNNYCYCSVHYFSSHSISLALYNKYYYYITAIHRYHAIVHVSQCMYDSYNRRKGLYLCIYDIMIIYCTDFEFLL